MQHGIGSNRATKQKREGRIPLNKNQQVEEQEILLLTNYIEKNGVVLRPWLSVQ